MGSAAALRSRIDQAAEKAESEKAKLFKKDGSKLYSDIEHAEREEAIFAELGRVVEEVSETADELAAKKQEEIYRHRHGDPTEDLSDSLLESANARRVFIREDCEDLPLDELAKRLRGVLAAGKKETIWLYSRYARRRATQLLEELRLDAERNPNSSNARAETSARLQDLQEVLKELEEQSGLSSDKEAAEKAQAEIKAAAGVKQYARKKRGELDGSDARARASMRRSVRF